MRTSSNTLENVMIFSGATTLWIPVLPNFPPNFFIAALYPAIGDIIRDRLLTYTSDDPKRYVLGSRAAPGGVVFYYELDGITIAALCNGTFYFTVEFVSAFRDFYKEPNGKKGPSSIV